jgi:hypothetical protein
MSFISEELIPVLWISTAISILIFIIFALALREDLIHPIRRIWPGSRRAIRRPPHKPLAIWLMFWSLALFSLVGTGGVLVSFTQAPSDPAQGFSAPPLPSPTPLPPAIGSRSDALQVSLRFPPNLDPCNVDALTIIPEEVNPYELPLIYPIEPWFLHHQFVHKTFAEVNVTNQSSLQDIQLENKVLARVVRYEPLPGPLNAAFSLCDVSQPASFPTLGLNSTTQEASLVLGEGLVSSNPGDQHAFVLQLLGDEPGLYEIQLGIEYEHRGRTHRIWSDESVLIRTPETLQRWSAGVVTYWGECDFTDGDYLCEEADLVEPILTPSPTIEPAEPTATADVVCSPSPPTRLEPGIRAMVSERLGLRLRIRAEPGLDQTILHRMARGTIVRIFDGPVCADGYRWWGIDLGDRGTGWVAEGEPNLYYLEPLR